MRAFANILRNYNHRQVVQSPKVKIRSTFQSKSFSLLQKHSSSTNLLMVCDDNSPEQAWHERPNSTSVGSMNSDPLCCPLARSHDDLSPLGDIGRMRPDLLPGQINDIDERKSNHSF
jgi:hypothetical protein